MTYFSRTDKSLLGRWWWTVDRGLLAAIFAVIIFGIVLVVTASPPVAMRIGLGQYHFVIRHLIILVPSVIIMLGISFLDARKVWRLGALMMIGCFFALIYVLIFGVEIKGAQRWIHLPGFSLQPSEFAKTAMVIVAAWFIGLQKDRPDFPGTKIAIGIYAVTASLFVLQPDIGMTFILTSSFLTIIFLAGLPLRIIAILIGGAVAGVIAAYHGLPHVKSRVDRFLDPESGDTFQIERSLEAFRSGGIFGTGPGQGEVKLGIPDAHADFIFSVAGEELGLFFIVILIGLYGFILLRGFNRIMDSNNMFVILATGGLLTMFGLQALVHMGSALHLLPTKGMTLPFISYGGSSLLSISIAMGMVLALTRRQSHSGISRSGISARPIGGSKL